MIQSSIIQKKYYQVNQIDQTEYSQIVWERLEKIEKYDLLKSESCSEEAIFEVIKTSRASLFRWKKNYKLYGLIGLESESRRPNNVRKQTWSKEIENRIYHLRKQYPLWGKAKLAVIYKQKYNAEVSTSMVGRIIKKLVKFNKVYPVKFLLYKKVTKNRVFSGHAKRWTRDMKAKFPGELIQIDHMTIGKFKQFSAICPITKIAVQEIYEEATARNAASFLKKVLLELPFPLISVQVDGGGEFMGEFEKLCQKLNIPLFVLPPRSPENNCNVERGNGTFKYEFHAQNERVENLYLLRKDLQKFVKFYNSKRPHHGVRLLTPYSFYESIKDKGGLQSHM